MTTARDLKIKHLTYDVKKVMQVLQKFCESEAGTDAGVQLLSYQGTDLPVKEFNIREIRLVENKILGARMRVCNCFHIKEQIYKLKNLTSEKLDL